MENNRKPKNALLLQLAVKDCIGQRMLRTPLKSKKNVNVNKPFKSPFESPAQREESCRKARQKSDQNAAQSPLTTRNNEAKRILVLDDNEKEKKRRKLSENNDRIPSETTLNQDCSESKKHNETKENRKLQDLKDLRENKSDKDDEKIIEGATKNNLQLLKRRVFELKQELDCLKSKERCTKKHDPGDLKVSIKKKI